jgi:hypothetical protein
LAGAFLAILILPRDIVAQKCFGMHSSGCCRFFP